MKLILPNLVMSGNRLKKQNTTNRKLSDAGKWRNNRQRGNQSIIKINEGYHAI
ncbi:hypothetical protein WMZ97_10675 [Lentibacillus sp. N15]|uniref:hypothetical protein n=1 Tax=Lentibacillus songyuanensis TaxID=3136161 RepID=UPI0031BA464D